jgi:hypothetical protein
VWKITRYAGPGTHVLGTHVLIFGPDGSAMTDEAEVASRAEQFPVAFIVERLTKAWQPNSAPYTEEALNELTAADLRKILAAHDVPASRATKAEMVTAILELEEG